MNHFWSIQAPASVGGQLLQLNGVAAAITPASPGRLNCFMYQDATALAGALDVLTAAYRGAGVRVWATSVHESDVKTVALLRRWGYVCLEDAINPQRAMGLDLTERHHPQVAGIELLPDPPLEVVASINDASFGFSEGSFVNAFRRFPRAAAHAYVCALGATPASAVLAYDCADDSGVYLVATIPEARGRGFATALMAKALDDAEDRGCRTSTLQASKMGYPLYASLGYRDLGRLDVFEYRAS